MTAGNNTDLGTVVICTALDVEYRAARDHLHGPLQEEVGPGGAVYQIGAFPADHGVWTVALTQSGPGNTQAGIEIDRAIAMHQPRCVLFVGVAGGRKDVARGDVVVASHVYDYETGKDTAGGRLPRIKTHTPANRLLQRAQQIARDDAWQHRIRPLRPETRPRAIVKPVAAGSTVIADPESATARYLDQHCGDAVAVEMEGYGFLHGAYTNDAVDALVVRGISDLLSGKTEAADQQWQPIAAQHAAAFAFELLARHTAPSGPATPRQASAAPARGGSSGTSLGRLGIITIATLAVLAAAVTGVIALTGGFDATAVTGQPGSASSSATPPSGSSQAVDTSAPAAGGTLAAKNNEWMNLAKGYTTDMVGAMGDRTDLHAWNLTDPTTMELFGASDTVAFAAIDGDVSKQSCFTALKSRRDRSVKATPDLIGRWVCVQTWNNGIAAIKIDKVDPVAASINLSYVVWK
jgi:nucleoside phosphorylase